MESALYVANPFVQTNIPAVGPLPVDANRGISSGKLREWICKRIRDGVAKSRQPIKCDEFGRAYYCKSIPGQCFGGYDATIQADEDKVSGVG